MLYRSSPSGISHDLHNPEPAKIRLADIAWHLANLQRYNGGCVRSYTVAEHAIRVALLVGRHPLGGPRFMFAALHHDDHEAFLGDLSAPLLVACPQLEGLHSLWAGACDVARDITVEERTNVAIKQADLDIRKLEAERVWYAQDIFDHVRVVPRVTFEGYLDGWDDVEFELRSMGVLARPSFKFQTCESANHRSQLATLFLACSNLFRDYR